MSENNPYKAPGATIEGAPNADTQILSGRWQRLGAALLDGLILSVLIFPILFTVLGGFSAYFTYATEHPIMLPLMAGLLSFAAYLAINGYFLNQNGQTIGKKIVGIKIVRTDGSKADFNWIITRRVLPLYAMQMVPFAGGLLSVIDALLIFRDSKQCLHDTIADTKVVDA